MSHIKKENDDILKKIGNIKPGQCPNFCLFGKSISVLEKTGMDLAKKIEDKKLLIFKGAVTKFTILMPYFRDSTSAEKFMLHLKNSISIAKDCYDRFCGIILIELSKEWGEHGFNPSLNKILEYIRKNSNICFILLFPVSEKYRKEEEFYYELSKCSIWMKIFVKNPLPHECISLFRSLAREQGYSITDEAKDILFKKLKQRDEIDIDNLEIVQQLFQQIVFEYNMGMKNDKTICEKDVMYITGVTKEKEDYRIGFVANI